MAEWNSREPAKKLWLSSYGVLGSEVATEIVMAEFISREPTKKLWLSLYGIFGSKVVDGILGSLQKM